MADFKVVGKLVIDDKGQLKVLGKKAKGASQQLDRVGTSAQTADRRLKGAAQASSGGSKNFSKMAQGINGGLVPAYATLAASLFAIGALFRGLQEAANIKNQTKGMEIFGEATGIAMKGIVADLRAATGGMLDFRTAAQQAQIATAAGFNSQQIIELGKGAKLASVALGRDLTDSFNRLLRGVTKAEPELLDELGIILRIDDATRKYAQANDLVASKLTIAQRRSAVFEEVSRQLANNFSAFEDGADGALNSFSKLQVAFSDIIKGLTVFIGPLEYVAEFLAANTGAAAVIFAGFASSIMKSAFPALTNMTTALQTYQSTSQSALRAEKARFQQMTIMFKKNAAEANFSELKKSVTFKKFLKKRGMDEAAFNNKSVTNQRRSISLMIANLQKRQAAGKVINDAELAYFIKTRNQMVGAQISFGAKVTGIAKATAGAAGAAITVPALLARTGLAQVGKAALKLAPVFKTLGRLMGGAFTIFSTGFIAKFMFELLFITKEEKEERQKIKGILDNSALKLKEINRIGDSMFEKGLTGAADTVEGLNSKLLQTFRLIQSIRGVSAAEDIIKEQGLSKTGRADLSSIITEQLTTFSSQGGNLEELLKGFNSGDTGDNVFGRFVGENTSLIGDVDKFIGDYVSESGSIDKKGIKQLQKTLQNAMSKGKEDSVLGFIDFLSEKLQKLADPGEVLDGVTKGAKNVKDALAVIGDGYKPTSLDALTASLTQLKNEFKSEDTAKLFKVINDMFGTDFGNNTAAENFVKLRETAAREIIGQQASTLVAKSGIAESTASLGSRKDAAAQMAKEKLKELSYSIDIGEVNNKIREQQEFLLLSENQGDEVAQRKLRTLELQLNVLKAQEKEYKRANTIAGQLQDTFQDGLDNTFQSIIDGTAKAKDAFKQLAVVVIQEMQRILAVRMASQIIGMMSGYFGDGLPDTSGPGPHMSPVDNPSTVSQIKGFTSTPKGNPFSNRYGGVVRKGYASGGIADGPDSGYNVLMHGREAIVPLPDGDRIPVQLTGKGQGPVNSVINITVNNEGDVESSAEESSALGEAIQMAVTREISEQQRPGGLLSPI